MEHFRRLFSIGLALGMMIAAILACAVPQDCLAHSSWVDFSVKNEEGAPIQGATVVVTNSLFSSHVISGETDKQGQFDSGLLDTFQCSRVSIEVRADGYETFSTEYSVYDVGAYTADVVLQPLSP